MKIASSKNESHTVGNDSCSSRQVTKSSFIVDDQKYGGEGAQRAD